MATADDWRRIRSAVLADAEQWQRRRGKQTKFVLLATPITGLLLGGFILERTAWGALVVIALTLGFAVSAVIRIRSERRTAIEDPLVVSAKVVYLFEIGAKESLEEPMTLYETHRAHLQGPETRAITEDGRLVPGPAWPDPHTVSTPYDIYEALREGMDVVLVCQATGRAVERLRKLLPAPSAQP
jgi:hypothetical protein